MSEIPKDIMAAALRALMVPEHDMVESVSRALLAERERAAKLADDKAAEYEAETDMWPCAGPIAVRLRGLAEAIQA